MATQIASLFAKIGADTSGFQREMRGVDNRLSGVQKAVGVGLKAAVGVGIGAVAALGATIAKTTGMAADMEQAVADIAATMGLTAEETERVDDLITDLGLGPNLKVTAVEAAQAIEMLGKNGVALDDILGGVARSTVLLANSTGADFGQAADIATDAMAQFNLTAEDMAGVVNQITGVTTTSKFDINDYGLALAQAGGVAGSVGVEFDDFNATIAAISPSFSGGSDAGTSFKVMLQRLNPQSNKAKELMQDLGIITAEGANQFFTATGEMRGMSEIASVLQGAFSGLSEEQRIAAASTIFGTDAMRAAFALADAGEETIIQLKSAIGDVDAEERAATRMDTFRGALEIAQGVIETLGIQIGKEFLPLFRALIEQFTQMADRHGPRVVEWFGKLADVLATGISYLAETVKTGSLLNSELSNLPEPIQNLIRNADELYTRVRNLVQPIIDVIDEFVSWQDVLTALAVVVASVAIPALASFVAAAAPVLATGVALIAGVAALRNAWEMDFGGIQEKTRTVLDWVDDRFGGLFESIQTFGVDALGEIVAWARGNETEFEATRAIWNEASTTFRTVVEDMRQAIETAWPGIRDTLTAWGETAFSVFAEQFPGAAEILISAWDDIKRNWNELVAEVLELLEMMGITWGDEWAGMGENMDKAVKFVQAAVEILSIAVTTVVEAIINALTLVVQLLQGDWAGAWETTQELVGGVVTGLKDIVTTGLRGILQVFGVSLEDIVAKVDSFKDKFMHAGEELINGLRQGVVNKWDSFKDWLQRRWKSLASGFTSFFGISSPSKLFETYGGNLVEGLASGISNQESVAVAAVDALSKNLVGAIDTTIQQFNKAVSQGLRVEGFFLNASGEWVPRIADAIPSPLPTERSPAEQAALDKALNAPPGEPAYKIPWTPEMPSLAIHTPLNKTIKDANKAIAKKTFGDYNLFSTLNQIKAGSLDSAIRMFQDFGKMAGQAFSASGAQVSPVARAYIDTVANAQLAGSGSSTANILFAIQGLIRAIEQKGLGSNFNIEMAPESTGDAKQDLINVVQYLQALNA